MPLTPPPHNRHASPTAVTPTPGSSSFHYSGAPLTSLKPFNAGNAAAPTTRATQSGRKPHPLAQVSMMESAGTSLSDDEQDLGLSRTVDLDHLRGSRKGGMVRISLAETEEDEDQRSLDERLAQLDETDPYGYGRHPSDLEDEVRQEYDSAFSDEDDAGSLHIGLSSPGVGRSGPAVGGRLSDAPLGHDLSYGAQGADFSRDLSALDIPISPGKIARRRPTAPTPNHASRHGADENQNFHNISSTPSTLR